MLVLDSVARDTDGYFLKHTVAHGSDSKLNFLVLDLWKMGHKEEMNY